MNTEHTHATPQPPIIRCNRCGLEFWSEEALAILAEDGGFDGGYYRGCPNCKTDAYLMDLDTYTDDM